jgi:DNA replication protein DnaC
MSYLIETSLPPLHRDWDIKDMVGADNLEDVQHKVVKYLTDPNVLFNGNSVYIYSVENGTGKTRTAYYMLYELNKPRLDQHGNVVIVPMASVTFGEFLKFCEDRFSPDAKEARRIVMTAPILLLDDVSPAFGTSNVQADRRELLLLMKYRREHLLLTIITSNLTPEAFEKLYGATASSKVLENFSYIEVRGGDVRQAIYPDQLQNAETEDEEACR